jgi:hypothetical protein
VSSEVLNNVFVISGNENASGFVRGVSGKQEEFLSETLPSAHSPDLNDE